MEENEKYTFSTSEGLANEVIASMIMSEKALAQLEQVSPEAKLAILSLVADGMITEKDGKYTATERGRKILGDLEDDELQF